MTICSVAECRGRSTHADVITMQTQTTEIIKHPVNHTNAVHHVTHVVVFLCREHAARFPNAVRLKP